MSIPSGVDRAQSAADWKAWHRDHERRRADRHGFLAITGLHWLTQEPVRLDRLPGRWSTGAHGPVVELDPGEQLQVEGAIVSGRHAFGPLPERGGTTARSGDVAIEIARRGGHDIVRPRDPQHPFLARYEGTPVYGFDPRWRVEARYLPYPAPRPTEVGAAVDGLTHVYDVPGELEFALDGDTFHLVAFPGYGPGDLFVLFADATSGLTTYAANRSVVVETPDADGRTVLDFNRSVNLPCAYTDFATCPLPPSANRLPIGIEAGEKTPLSRISAADAEVVPG